MRQRFVDEQVARGPANDLQYPGVGDAFFVQALDQPLPGSLGGHADAATQHIVLFATHQRSPSSQPSRLLKASLKVRSSCSGVIET
ncbi:hypothetical protein D9M69_710630 [compost metagenome]